jgi:hypothetical protein
VRTVLLSILLLAGASDPLQRLGVWVERARSTPRSVDARRHAELRAILGELRVARAAGGADQADIDLALVELASLEARESSASVPAVLAAAQLGKKELEAELARAAPALAPRLAATVLDPAARRSRDERLLVARLLASAHVPATLGTLQAVAREQDLELAQAARAALAGWDSPAVHRFFLDELARSAPCTGAAAEHFAAVCTALDDDVLTPLAREVARRYLSEDWRDAARARGLCRALDPPRAVPILIEALAAWERRTRSGTGSRRIQAEIVEELQRLSGRGMGAEPERWSEWWLAVRSGRIALPADIAAAGGQTSSAAFFGLRAVTDRVLFVVDRSGSMRTAFGTGGRSRHAEAIDQLVRFLRQSGEDTRFSVAVFGSDGTAWRTRLATATDGNLELVEKWLERKEPDGETLLFEGLRAGLGLDARGRLDLARCEADTVIVLCDGATTEGPGWVERWLATENEAAQLVFHCVQIGVDGNGTLEALAEGSDGEFVRVQG